MFENATARASTTRQKCTSTMRILEPDTERSYQPGSVERRMKPSIPLLRLDRLLV